MKKLSLICCLITTSLLFNACKSYNEDEIKTVANNFLDAMHKPVDFKKMKENFHDFPFMSVHRTDEHSIESIKEIDGKIIVDVTTSFTDYKKEKYTNNFLLKFEKVNEEWKIVNSKGLSNIKGSYPNAYKFAQNSNLLNDNIWDVDLLKIIKKAKKELKDLQKSLQELANENIRANELVKKSDKAAAEVIKAFEELDLKDN